MPEVGAEQRLGGEGAHLQRGHVVALETEPGVEVTQ